MSSFIDKFKHVPPVTLALIVINIAIYVLLPIIPTGSRLFESGAISAAGLMSGEWWSLVTSMFLHSGIMHITCNMISLYYLGVMCEKIFGSLRFLLLYFLSGLAGNIVFVIANIATGSVYASAVGASGAIFGLFGAYGYLLIREYKNNRIFVYPPSKADIQSYILILVVNLMIGLSPGSGIANEAHLGGMICGVFIAIIMYALITRLLPGGSGYRGRASNTGYPPQTQHSQYKRNRQATDHSHPPYDDPHYR